ncbi:DcaP family trimeric outer membrane transporter [Mangrovivirga sp. M17]|uniref:DcaP family trimeric outer membrane transporter n=1 Tax=Mangrovivirga halotolerans TaxID=2993936 RepID=A0ABT3RQC8_9BACT|nr:DcaP family trimeric outer membrane transporter [Mangrovivirga halotolerans]MCX2743836.1 DcaP family trimeric outer membrane transporter [Mangrovivirga halotolerans]
MILRKSQIVSVLYIAIILAATNIFAQNTPTSDTVSNQFVIPEGDLKETVLRTATEQLDYPDFKGSWPMFGTDIRMKIGGYFKVDFIYDFDGTRDPNQFLMSTIPVEGQPEYGNEGYVYFFAKETRINIDLRRISNDKMPLQAFVEGDFFTDGNRFRLRHAYITAGDFIIGQTWTTLSFLESMATMIDFAAGDALFGGRSVQIRYQSQLSKTIKFYAGLEYMAFLGIENPYNLPGKANIQFPLLALRMDKRWNSGVLFLGASITQLRWDGGETGPDDHIPQLSFVIAGRQYIGKNNYFTYNLSLGDAYGENIIAFAGSNANAVLNENGVLQSIQGLSAMVGFMHRWTPKLESNFNYAYGWLDAPDDRAPLALIRGGIGHLNLIRKYDDHFSTGIEYMWGAQRTANDAFGDASRIQFMAKFEF